MSRPTHAQRHTICGLLREAEFDTRTVTFQHRRLGVSEAQIGGSVDAWLDSLSIEQASVLIDKLQREVA